jgi:spore coat polysaccharide biosynthesis predicted glycosyltransferase SpsG
MTSSRIMLLADGGFGSGYGHLTRITALGKVLLEKHKVCLHGNIEENEFTRNILSDAGFRTICSCEYDPNMVITDSYKIDILDRYPRRSSRKIVALVDELSPFNYADAYIQASPIKNWRPMNTKAPVKTFENDPIVRDHFYPLSDSGNFKENGNGILLLLGSLNPDDYYFIEIFKVVRQVTLLPIYVMSNFMLNPILLNEYNATEILRNTNFVDVVKKMNLTISAAGVTAWELLVLKVNCLFFSAVLNQEFQLDYLIENSLASGIHLSNKNPHNLVKLETLIRNAIDRQTPTMDIENSICNGTNGVIHWLEKQNFIY